MVPEGESNTTPEMLPTVIPELRNGSVTSVVRGHNYFGAVLSPPGDPLTWGGYSEGALGLGDSGEPPVGSPGGYEGGTTGSGPKYGYPQDVTVSAGVRFDHGLAAKERVER